MSMNHRYINYSASDDQSQNREERLVRLKLELREHIRMLSDYDILSTDWLKMAESLSSVANVAFMENHLPPSSDNPLKQAGKKGKGTLWDQERDELAIRILLEEGKLNLALRILHKFKQLERDTSKYTAMITACCTRFSTDVHKVTKRCRHFESSLGVLLSFAFNHVESLQIMDTPEFMEHVGEVLQDAIESKANGPGNGQSDKLQDTIVLHYLDSLCANLEEMDEDAIMGYMEEHQIMHKVIVLLNTHPHWYRVDTLVKVAHFLSNAMASDSYCTEPELYVVDEETEKLLLSLNGSFIAELQEKGFLKRKDIVKLLDQIRKLEKKHGKAATSPLQKHQLHDKNNGQKNTPKRSSK